MRFLLLLLSLLLFSISFSQSSEPCDSIFKSTTDQFSGKTETSTDLVIIENDGKKLGWRVYINKGKALENYLMVSLIAVDASGLGCIDDNAKIIFLFEDDTRKEFANGFKFNCDGIGGFSLYYKGLGSKQYQADFKKLAQTKVKAIRITLTKEYYDFTFSKEQSAEILNAFSCAASIAGL